MGFGLDIALSKGVQLVSIASLMFFALFVNLATERLVGHMTIPVNPGPIGLAAHLLCRWSLGSRILFLLVMVDAILILWDGRASDYNVNGIVLAVHLAFWFVLSWLTGLVAPGCVNKNETDFAFC